jgi:mannosyltransferase OCH1-like enzyme
MRETNQSHEAELARRGRLPTVPKWPKGTSIPRVIHQTYPTRTLPAALQASVDRLKDSNPGWEHRLYDNQDIERAIESSYGKGMLAYYQRLNPDYGAARADLFRYLLMYRFGGVYLDIKSSSAKPLDDIAIQGTEFVLSKWDNGAGGVHEGWGLHRELDQIDGGEFQQWHIVSVAGHPFLKAVIENVLVHIDRYRPWKHGVGAHGVHWVTGPIPYTLAITRLLPKPCISFPNERDIGLEYNSIGASHHGLFRRHYLKNTSSVVRMKGWRRPLAACFGVSTNVIKSARRVPGIFRRLRRMLDRARSA